MTLGRIDGMNRTLRRCVLGVAGLSLTAVTAAGLSPTHAADSDASEGMAIDTKLDRVRISFESQLITQYIFKGWQRPVMSPVIGPAGVRMTRAFPFDQDSQGESHDHPHHQSLWYGHGDISGTRFWKTEGTVEHQALLRTDAQDGEAVIKTHNHWLAPDDGHVLSDTRTITIRVHDDGSRTIDYAVRLIADEGEVTIGDTKEGTMGIRTHPGLRLDGKRDSNGRAMNSEGVRGKSVWGERADWVNYWGTIGGRDVGIMIFDHPANPRHPTWWHARHYGLIAANPFGISYFDDKPRGTGDMKLAAGESITFRYRFVFYPGRGDRTGTNRRYQAWVSETAASGLKPQ